MRLDRVVQERTLLTPDQAAALATSACARDADGWVRFQGPGGLAFEWPDPPDFVPCDMLSVSLRVGAPVWRLFALIELKSLEPGTDRPNRYHVGTPGLRAVQGEFRFDLPFENFHMDGFPDGWKGIRRFRLEVGLPSGGVAAVGPVFLVQRERAPGPRLTDEELFTRELDLDRPGLETVREAVRRDDLEAACRSLLAYYDGRRTVAHEYGRPKKTGRSFGREMADRFMEGMFSGQRFGDPIDWRANPNGYLEWRHAFNRHYALGALFHAWRDTGDGRYLARLDDALARWMAVSPEPVGMNDGGGDPAWETLSVSCRVNWSWLDIFFGTGDAAGFRPRTRLDMLKSLFAHAEHLVRWEGCANNWVIAESQAVALCGIMFPEFRRAAEWRRVGFERLAREMRRQVWPDGAQNEVSAGYHWMTGAAFGETMLLARANGLALPQGYAETVEKMAEYPMYLTRPNLTAPSFNDSGGVNGTTEAALRFGSEVFGRKDMLWLLTRRREGSPPPETSRAFVDAGLYVMRSDWSDQANWLAFRGGNIGAAHMHEDRLGFDLAACGSTVLVDPGAANYKPDELRAWSLSTAAHNTAVLDGLGQCQRPRPWEERTASVRDVNFWSSSPDVDVAAARYAGPYGVEPQTLNAVHYREIHFVKPAFWVMVDAFSAAGQHTASLFFHFMPMVVDVLAKAGIVHTRRYGNPNLEVHCVGWPEGTRFTKRCGSLDPVQGWVALDGEWVPAPCVQADAPFRDQLILVTLLIPLSSGLESGFAVASPGPGRWRLETPDGPFEIALVGDSRDLSGPRATPLARASRLPR